MKKYIETRGNLELYQEESGLRHYLDGREVRCGTGLEILMENGEWMPVRYECALFKGLKESFEGKTYGPVPELWFLVRVAGKPKDEGEKVWYYPDACIAMPDYGRVRWPEGRGL